MMGPGLESMILRSLLFRQGRPRNECHRHKKERDKPAGGAFSPCGIVGESIGREAGYLACRGFRL